MRLMCPGLVSGKVVLTSANSVPRAAIRASMCGDVARG